VQPVAVAVGERHVVRVLDLAFGGDGVARVDDFVVFVPFVIPGEQVEVEITEVKRSFSRARPIRVLQPSPHRVDPRCAHFGRCGGCQYQHVDYPLQLELKHKQIVDLLERIGGFPAERVAPLIPCPRPYGYRNRVEIRSQWNPRERKLHVGFVGSEGRQVVDITECSIAQPELNEQIRRIRSDPPGPEAGRLTLRVAPEGWEVPGASFFQNNPFLLPQLVETARGFLRAAGSRQLVDAHCGVGLFALELADDLDRYVGIESDQQAVEAARRNARSRGRCNGEFLWGRTEDRLAEALAGLLAGPATVLLDPPRTGCSRESLERMRKIRPAQVIFVSCHPATLARDLKLLCADGVFQLRKIVPLDMFPHTHHVECVADLRSD
jgi:tRNA/tmRNA/rRNA uracil-C5-methylase (TrmA/RlmC/RlmD family)